MKKLMLSLIVMVAAAGFTMAQKMEFQAVDGQGGNVMEWNYGTIENSSNGVRIFKFKNTGDAPLQILNARGSCGCTVPTYSKEPVMPGSESEIQVKYDTKRTGAFTKTVTLTTNDKEKPTMVLKIFGTVKPPKPANTPAVKPIPVAQPQNKVAQPKNDK